MGKEVGYVVPNTPQPILSLQGDLRTLFVSTETAKPWAMQEALMGRYMDPSLVEAGWLAAAGQRGCVAHVSVGLAGCQVALVHAAVGQHLPPAHLPVALLVALAGLGGDRHAG